MDRSPEMARRIKSTAHSRMEERGIADHHGIDEA